MDRADYPMQEGTFFGDIFDAGSLSAVGLPTVAGPVAYYCDGAGFPAGASGVVAGRLGANQANAPYKNPFGNGALCQTSSGTTPQYSKGVSGSCPPQITNPPPSGCPDGYSSIRVNGGVWNYPITVWRNNNYTPQFDTSYQYTLSPAARWRRRWTLAPARRSRSGTRPPICRARRSRWPPSGTGWKMSPLANRAMCLDAGSGAAGNGVNLASCNGGAGQTFAVTPDAQSGYFFIKVSNTGRCVQVRNNGTSPGSAVEVADCAGTAGQKFNIQASTFAPADGADYNFENGTQGWTSLGSPGIGVAATNVVSFAGSQSLAVALNGGAGTVFASSGSLSPPAGALVTFNFYLPPGSPITSIQPYVQQGAAANWAWTGNFQPLGSLRAGTWSALKVLVPANAQPIARVGIIISTGSTGAATVYVDSVAW